MIVDGWHMVLAFMVLFLTMAVSWMIGYRAGEWDERKRLSEHQNWKS